jgi:citronellol/citronellal dehydrogenase
MTQPEQQFGRSDDELAAMPLTFRDGLFDGQVALVSGSGRGIGKAIAYQLARLGAKVALCGRDEARLNAT